MSKIENSISPSPKQNNRPKLHFEGKEKLLRQPLDGEMKKNQEEEERREMPRAKQRISDGSTVLPPPSDTESIVDDAVGEGGQPLPESELSFFEPRFGHDFSRVNIHTGAKATEVARAMNARAFTVGRNIVFGEGQYNPRSSEGQLLLAHELTHFVQQYQGIVLPAKLYRQKAGSAQREVKKRNKFPSGKVSYFSHPSFKEKKLDEENIKSAIGLFLAVPIGKEVVSDLESKSVTVKVYFVADGKNIPTSGEPAGYCDPVGPNLFDVYVTAGQRTTVSVPTGRGSIELVEKIVDRDPASVSDSLFHEMLHAWFITYYQDSGTGHTEKVKPTVEFLGTKTYDEEEYDPVFLERLKRFDKEFNELKTKLKKRTNTPAKQTDTPKTIQPKLIVGQPDDIYEQEADRVAEAVMQPTSTYPSNQRHMPYAADATPYAESRDMGETASQWTSNGSRSAAISDNLLGNMGSGDPIELSTRTFMETRFGHNFSNVRVHTDAKAAESAKALNALAYTVGKDIVFSEEYKSLSRTNGLKTLAHELVHTVQQESIQTESCSTVVQRQKPPADQPESEKLPPEMEETVNRVEKLIQDNWKDYIEKAAFKTPLKDIIIWHKDKLGLIKAKYEFAAKLAERDASKLKEDQKKKIIEKYKGSVSSDKPTFEEVKRYYIMNAQMNYFIGLGGDEVPAFYDNLNQKIHTAQQYVGVIAHEALHHYSAPELRKVLGGEIDEGLTHYLAEEIEQDYSSKYSKETGLIRTITNETYAKNVKIIRTIIESGRLKENAVVKAYFKGDAGLLTKLNEAIKKAKLVETKEEE
ncbi:MAG: DUF4157 domain-containing protein [Thaumarchaeota archaeon]|nr:DUF4157 domain-containing protein [Nitrososphaerota archaeon]MCL5317196.1 DUF4157 domain-containing protein [Nitrososphaerota archaeon]